MARVEDAGVVVGGIVAPGGVAPAEGMAMGVARVVLASALKCTPLVVSCLDSSEPTVPVDPTIRMDGVIIGKFYNTNVRQHVLVRL